MINVRLKRLFQVFVIEELRVIKASSNNTLVAIDDSFGTSRVAIAYHNKTIGKLAILVIQREITLVNQHGINNDFFGNFQEFFVESANKHSGILGQINNFNKRLRMKHRSKAGFSFGFSNTFTNNLLAFSF